MLVDELLFAFVFNDDRKIVETADIPADLEAIHQIDDDRQVFLAHVVQEAVLQVHGRFRTRVVHVISPPNTIN